MITRSVVAGCGAYLPERILTNAELARTVQTSDEWIVQRTGIRQRHIAAENERTSDLALAAAQRALDRREGEVGGALIVRRDMALADTGALDDPLVRGLDGARELLVGQDPFGQIGPAASDDGACNRQDAAARAAEASDGPCTASSLMIFSLKPLADMSTATPMALAKPNASVPP